MNTYIYIRDCSRKLRTIFISTGICANLPSVHIARDCIRNIHT